MTKHLKIEDLSNFTRGQILNAYKGTRCKAELRADIYEAAMNSKSYKELAGKFGRSEQSVKSICLSTSALLLRLERRGEL